jgi:hypothetical protein
MMGGLPCNHDKPSYDDARSAHDTDERRKIEECFTNKRPVSSFVALDELEVEFFDGKGSTPSSLGLGLSNHVSSAARDSKYGASSPLKAEWMDPASGIVD